MICKVPESHPDNEVIRQIKNTIKTLSNWKCLFCVRKALRVQEITDIENFKDVIG